ncbi:MAG: response regulator [Rhodospirillaceae bacterium]|nr:response regulator [Rhodospirillaceae bacterium]
MNAEYPDFSRYGFVVADDKAFIRGLIQSMLLKCGVRNIKHANSGEEAMNLLALRTVEIDCIICDWNMEPVNGLELLKFVRSGSIPYTKPELPVVMLTGHADVDVVKCAIALDVHGYLVKPVSMEKLIDAVGKALVRHFVAQPAEHYLAVPLAALPAASEGPQKPAAPWVLWPRAQKQRQDLAQRLGQMRKEAADQIKAAAQSGQKRKVVNPRKIALAEIPPGLVLAEDILTPDGTVLLAAGVALTETLLSRLREIASGGECNDTLTVGDLVAS